MQALPKSRLLRFVEEAFQLAHRAVARYSSKFSKQRYTLHHDLRSQTITRLWRGPSRGRSRALTRFHSRPDAGRSRLPSEQTNSKVGAVSRFYLIWNLLGLGICSSGRRSRSRRTSRRMDAQPFRDLGVSRQLSIPSTHPSSAPTQTTPATSYPNIGRALTSRERLSAPLDRASTAVFPGNDEL